MDTVTVDLFLSHRCMRIDIPLRGFTRVSDVLNNTPSNFLAGSLRGVSDLPEPMPFAEHSPARDMVVRLADVLLARPVASAPGSSSSAERRDRILQRVVLELGDWRLTGSLHLIDSVRWTDYATAMNDRFLAVTDATVQLPYNSASLESPFLLVNGARISALYEC